MTRRLSLRRTLQPIANPEPATAPAVDPLAGAPYVMYAWHGILTDYTSGMAVAHARSVEEARELLRLEWLRDRSFPARDRAYWVTQSHKFVREELREEPDIYPHGGAAYVHGGG